MPEPLRYVHYRTQIAQMQVVIRECSVLWEYQEPALCCGNYDLQSLRKVCTNRRSRRIAAVIASRELNRHGYSRLTCRLHALVYGWFGLSCSRQSRSALQECTAVEVAVKHGESRVHPKLKMEFRLLPELSIAEAC
jgi:hypothetical protein